VTFLAVKAPPGETPISIPRAPGPLGLINGRYVKFRLRTRLARQNTLCHYDDTRQYKRSSHKNLNIGKTEARRSKFHPFFRAAWCRAMPRWAGGLTTSGWVIPVVPLARFATYVEMKVRTLLTRRKRRRKSGAGWRRWSNEYLYDVLGLYWDWKIQPLPGLGEPARESGRRPAGPITLSTKLAV
jgi:hypothetical protein